MVFIPIIADSRRKGNGSTAPETRPPDALPALS